MEWMREADRTRSHAWAGLALMLLSTALVVFLLWLTIGLAAS